MLKGGIRDLVLTRNLVRQELLKPMDITDSITDLKQRNRIFGEPPTLDQFLEPTEEHEIGQSLRFEGGDTAIAAAVTQEIAEKNSEVIEVDSDNEDEDTEPEISRKEALELCSRLEGACLQLGDARSAVSLTLISQLRLFRAHIRREELLHGRQTTLDTFFTS
ncbi:hypothetical protein J3R83DRAFT_1608 [Lanmaoa asiatica]|nr:hypothetical protein J3R83DRAFT_1608 [Lanmaoa asiatica]